MRMKMDGEWHALRGETVGNNEKLFSIKGVTKVFTLGGLLTGSKLTAVNEVNFDLESDNPEIFTLAGESGSGKTTLARLMLHDIEPTHGKILYKGNDVTKIKKKKEQMQFMKEVQPIFQNPFETFNPLKRVDRYLYATTVNYGIADSRNNVERVIDDALKSVGLSLEEIRGRYPHELSGGQLQRVSVARALISRPSVLIADEPVSMVDASLRMSIVNLFKELKEKQGVSVVYITHDLATAYYISDRIAIMFRGSIVEMGSVEKVLGNPLHPYNKILKESVPKPIPDEKWEEKINLSMLEVKEFSKVGCKFAGRCPFVMDICIRENPKDFFLDERVVRCFLYVEKK